VSAASRTYWNDIFLVEECGTSKLEIASVTDDAMMRLAELECVTHLNIGVEAADR
jgi:hypothetical protein